MKSFFKQALIGVLIAVISALLTIAVFQHVVMHQLVK
jgi:hypothetical protein